MEEEREEERESEKETSKQAARNMLYYVLASIAHRAQEATCGRVLKDCGAARPRREEGGHWRPALTAAINRVLMNGAQMAPRTSKTALRCHQNCARSAHEEGEKKVRPSTASALGG